MLLIEDNGFDAELTAKEIKKSAKNKNINWQKFRKMQESYNYSVRTHFSV
jgi:hypothetical protein